MLLFETDAERNVTSMVSIVKRFHVVTGHTEMNINVTMGQISSGNIQSFMSIDI